jgi:Do/DeqQ family serine protease
MVLLAPSLAEQFQYHITRGKERAEVESARATLSEHKLDAIGHAFGAVAKAVGPSVVHIDVRVLRQSRNIDEAYYLGNRHQQFEAQGQGSGVIVDADGYILTNNHVIQGAREIVVKISDGRSFSGKVVGADTLTDLAVVKIDADKLSVASWGDSDALEEGSLVWAVGNPFGLDRSVTFGIISAKSRRGFGGSPYQDFLQTDAAVNPGNSGGPLVNINGEIVGINTAIIGRSFQGITFSIPSNMAKEVYDRLRTTGKVARGWLGVELAELTPEIAKKLQVDTPQGALVNDVLRGAPAEKAGIEPGDVIVEWNKHPIDGPTALSLLVARTKVGTKADAVVIRDGKRITVPVTVEERPSQ